MANISTQAARGIFTKMLIAVYMESTRPMSFLRSFFKTVENDTKTLSIEVQRGTEKLAVDVLRGTEGNRNSFDLSTEKIFEPPFYREWFEATDLAFYDRLFGADNGGDVDTLTFQSWIEKVADKLRIMQDKIERSYEKQCSEVFQTGIVQLVNGTNIDFKRKAEALVDLGAGNYWDAGTSDPINDLKNGAKFIRTAGKGTGGLMDIIMGDLALAAFLNNDAVKSRADIRNFKLDDLSSPQRNAEGGVLHGRVTIGSWEGNIWTYPEFFEDTAGDSIPYIGDKNIIVIPQSPKFTLGFASIPKIFRDRENAEFPEFIIQERAAFAVGNYVDARLAKHVFDVQSAGVAVPVAVDQIFTAQVLA